MLLLSISVHECEADRTAFSVSIFAVRFTTSHISWTYIFGTPVREANTPMARIAIAYHVEKQKDDLLRLLKCLQAHDLRLNSALLPLDMQQAPDKNLGPAFCRECVLPVVLLNCREFVES